MSRRWRTLKTLSFRLSASASPLNWRPLDVFLLSKEGLCVSGVLRGHFALVFLLTVSCHPFVAHHTWPSAPFESVPACLCVCVFFFLSYMSFMCHAWCLNSYVQLSHSLSFSHAHVHAHTHTHTITVGNTFRSWSLNGRTHRQAGIQAPLLS